MKIKADYANAPQWKETTIKSSLPKELKCLDEIAHNMWWAWNYEGRDLFKSLDADLYEKCNANPVLLLERLSYDRKEAIVKDKETMAKVKNVYKMFREYMDVKPNSKRPSVAYFCMEYGINQVVKIYSGGLGMLAGDYLKEASDSNVDMCAVGFLYRYGYFKQSLSMDGQQIANYDAQNFNSLPIERVYDENGNPMVVDVPYTNYQVHAYVWQMNVGRIKLYLLDTDNDMNSEFDRPITHSLYGGDWENRLKQEILLGIGGMLALKKMGIKKEIYHCNEGHAALCNLQRLCDYIEEDGLNFNQALELVRASSLYTVHTPVPAGHDYFDEALFGKYMGGYPQRLGISWDEFIGMGRENADDHNERFCLSTFACNTCQEVNGVSKLHGWVSQQMFSNIWKGYFPEENHVGYVTNGVHFPTWTATEWRKLYDTYFDKNFMNDQSNEEIWHVRHGCRRTAGDRESVAAAIGRPSARCERQLCGMYDGGNTSDPVRGTGTGNQERLRNTAAHRFGIRLQPAESAAGRTGKTGRVLSGKFGRVSEYCRRSAAGRNSLRFGRMSGSRVVDAGQTIGRHNGSHRRSWTWRRSAQRVQSGNPTARSAAHRLYQSHRAQTRPCTAGPERLCRYAARWCELSAASNPGYLNPAAQETKPQKCAEESSEKEML